MYKFNDLKQQITSNDSKVECPVKNCVCTVNRRRKQDKFIDGQFFCSKHKIYIYPSTFGYEKEEENLLWFDKKDECLLKKIKKVKRESRIYRENSEDAVTWNVFRYLEKQDLIKNFLKYISGKEENNSEIIFWSYSQKEDKTWSELYKSRCEFGETNNKGSEPDLIIVTDTTIFFIEAKVGADNKTVPRDKNNLKKYTEGGDFWFNEVFRNNYNTIAIENKKYELLRLWLLGTWVAKMLNKDFYLINLVLSDKEQNIEDEFEQHIKSNNSYKFKRVTWECIYRNIKQLPIINENTKKLLDYFENKTNGYKSGKLQRTFNINK
jgi:hypothetical protein